MDLNLSQTKYVGYTMKLDLKAREYKMLCQKLEEYKKSGESDTNQLQSLLEELKQNNIEILEIKKELEKLKSEANNEEKTVQSEDNTMPIEVCDTLWTRIVKKIKRMFKR